MADIFTKDKRSEIMSKIRSKNTKVERIVFSFLGKEKLYFQRHYRRACGSPDVALPRKKKAVFIDGDFWHGRDFSRVKKRLEGNSYWLNKISTNIKRDLKQRKELKQAGWKILEVWEGDLSKKSCQLKNLKKIKTFLKDDEQTN